LSSVVFILGAGASKQCGAPLMGDFFDIARDLLNSHKVGDKREQFEKVFSAIGNLQAVHSKAQLDLNNIESIFTVLELGNVIQRVPGLNSEEIPKTISALKELIVKTLELTILFPNYDNHINAPKPYDEFAILLKYLRKDAFPSQTVSVITFNYDIAVDMAICRADMGPNYIIGNTPDDRFSRIDVPLMKLHGSLNWAKDKENQNIEPLHLSTYLKKYEMASYEENTFKSLPIGSNLAHYFSIERTIEVESEPVIVPPSWNKADYHHALSDIWAAAAQNLSEAEYIFIIGYSLPETDSFFRHLYALGSVSKTALRKFIVFNPDQSGDVDNRFRALLGTGAIARYEYRPFTFEQAIDQIRNIFPKRA